MTIKINNLERVPNNDFVQIVHFSVCKDSEGFCAEHQDTLLFTQQSDDFIEFDDLTESIVIGWVQSSIDSDDINDLLDEKLTALKAPKLITGLPWGE